MAPVSEAHHGLEDIVLSVSGSGFEVGELRSGAEAFRNRPYVWTMIPPEFDGWQFTEISGGDAAQITAAVPSDGFVYVATLGHPPETVAKTVGAWERVPERSLAYSDERRTVLDVYRMRVTAGSSASIRQSGWAGVIVLAPRLNFKPIAMPREDTALPAPSDRPPGVIIHYLPAATGAFVGSPAIAILPDGSYIAAHDIFGPGARGDNTLIFRSTDRGANWQPIAQVRGQTWSSLFVHRGALYILGPDREFGRIVIRRSDDGGVTWTAPRGSDSGLLTQEAGMHCAPTPVIEANGRLWRAFENNPSGTIGRAFRAFVISAPIDSDLLRAESWTHTQLLPYNMRETGGNWLEGNAIVAPGGEVVDMLRISRDGIEKAALLHVSADGKSIGWNPERDRINFPGGGVKFTIRYDPISHRYWSLVNKQRDPSALRNVLSLTSSSDLIHWKAEATLLQNPNSAKHAFQYVDWQFDGDDIVAVSRTSWDGDTYHNANYLTFHRISNFRTAHRTVR